VTFRIATPADIDGCAAFEWMRTSDDLLWHVEAGLIFLAEDGDAVGYARLESFWKTMPYLALVVVREDRRGQGIGTGLLNFIGKELRGRGFSHLLSSSAATEPEPQAWHRRNGFEEIGTLAGLNAAGEDEVFFRLVL
jgi:GNAT superfamily N-acetyltransferase